MKTIILTCSAIASLPVYSQTLEWDFLLKMKTAPAQSEMRFLGEPFRGQVRVDASALSFSGVELLRHDESNPSFSVTVNFDGHDYDAFDDRVTGMPQLTFVDGEFTALDFEVALDARDYPEKSFLRIYPDQLVTYSPDASGEFEGDFEILSSSVPEPSVATSFIFSLLFLTLHRKRTNEL